MTFEKLLALGVVFLYSLGTLSTFLGALSKRRIIKVTANWLTLAGFATHTILTVTTFSLHSMDELSAEYFMRVLAWWILFVYLCAWRWLRLPFLALTASPLALLLCGLSMRQGHSGYVLPESLVGLFLGLHVWSLFLSIGLLAMAFGAGLLFLYMDRQIKRKTPMAEFARDLPSLSTFDKVNQAAVMAGFPLYTLGLMSGFIWAPMLAQTAQNPKVILSLFVWFLYALLFYQRMALGYRGRKTAIMVVLIFTISALSVGIDFTVSHHSTLLRP